MKGSSVSPEAMGNHGGIAVHGGHLHGLEGLAQGSDLVHLNEDGVGEAFRDAALEDCWGW